MLNNLKRDYFWNTTGVFAQNAISPLLLIAVTRINGIHDSGLFSFAFSLSIILWAVGMWGGRTYQVSDVTKEFSSRSYITLRLILSVVMLTVAIIFCIANQYETEKSGIIIALVLFKATESISDAFHGILQVHGKLFLVGRSLLYKASIGFIIFILIDLISKNVLVGCLGLIAVNTSLLIFYEFRIAHRLESLTIKYNQIRPFVREALNIMRRSAPVFAVVLFAMFSLNIPRYFIDQYRGEEIGYYGILAMPITLVVLLMTFVLQPRVVHLAELFDKAQYHDFNRAVKKILGVTCLIGLVIFIMTYVIGVPVLDAVFGLNFTEYKPALLIMVAGGIVNAILAVFINILIIMRHFKNQFYILLITNFLLILGSAAVVKSHGINGGVGLFAIANIIQLLLISGVYFRILRKVSYAA